MKNVIITLVFFLFSAFSVHATSITSSSNDTLLLHNGYTYKVRVIKIVADTVFYKTYSSEEVKFFLTREVKSILYDDGRVIGFTNQNDNDFKAISPVRGKKPSPSEMYEQGYRDGKFYYENRGIFWAGFGMGFFFWVYFLPLIPMAVASFTLPSARNQITNDIRLRDNKRRKMGKYLPIDNTSTKDIYEKFKDINYVRGYARAAKGRKAGKLWLGFLTGIGGFFLAFLLLYILLILLFFI